MDPLSSYTIIMVIGALLLGDIVRQINSFKPNGTQSRD
jgi:hypothetical protein